PWLRREERPAPPPAGGRETPPPHWRRQQPASSRSPRGEAGRWSRQDAPPPRPAQPPISRTDVVVRESEERPVSLSALKSSPMPERRGHQGTRHGDEPPKKLKPGEVARFRE
ncbi:MAG: hypothetical protein AAB731_01970, partial [Patescibacteria group bacterium]